MIFEIVVIGVITFLLALIYLRYREKKNKPTLTLFGIFLMYLVAIIFSWISKILVLYSGIDYIVYNTDVDPRTLASWFLLRIIDFRFSFLFVILALYLSYVLKVSVYEEGYKASQRLVIIILGLFVFIYSLLIYERGNVLLDAIAFLLVLIYMSIIYIPFLLKSFKISKITDNRSYRTAFISLGVMALSFILIFVNFLIDRILILFGGEGFSIFYFLAWSFAVIGILGAYLGYIRPAKA